jgi:chorismate mutase/prephenate dehydratase
MNQLEQARKQIDEIDLQIAQLYEKRLEAVEQVLEYKLENNMEVLDSSREALILERNAGYIQNEKYVDKYLNLQKFIMKESRNYQKSLLSREVVAYSGVEGAFSHMVSEKLFPNNPKLKFNNFEDVFAAVLNRQAEYGVIPLENTNSGLVGEVLDCLLKYPVYIHSICDQKIEQCLLGVPGATLKDISWVYSKDQALLQARVFLQGLQAQPVAYPNTALAAQYVAAQNDKSKAAIAAKEAAVLYNLNILASNIEENNTNTTRFLVISLLPEWVGERFGMCLTFKNEVGALKKVIEIISSHGLNMCSIQSRPLKGHPFEYFFFIEVENIQDETTIESCLADLMDVCQTIKPLGAYNFTGKETK